MSTFRRSLEFNCLNMAGHVRGLFQYSMYVFDGTDQEYYNPPQIVRISGAHVVGSPVNMDKLRTKRSVIKQILELLPGGDGEGGAVLSYEDARKDKYGNVWARTVGSVEMLVILGVALELVTFVDKPKSGPHPLRVAQTTFRVL